MTKRRARNAECPTRRPWTWVEVGHRFDDEGSAGVYGPYEKEWGRYIAEVEPYSQAERDLVESMCNFIRSEGIRCTVKRKSPQVYALRIPPRDQLKFIEKVRPYIRTKRKCKDIEAVEEYRRRIEAK